MYSEVMWFFYRYEFVFSHDKNWRMYMAVKFAEKVYALAQEIANNCQGLEAPFCTAECPMHTDAMGYIRHIREGRLDDAVRLIREKLFLPATLGRVCAHPCEKVCRRGEEFNEPLAIAALKRYAADKADRIELWDLAVPAPTGKRVAVVGSGPAGAQVAIDLRKAGHEVTIYEKLPVWGGMMRVGIPSYRLPVKVIDFEYSYLERLGIKFKYGVAVGKDVSLPSLRQQYDAVILAHGAHIGIAVKAKDTGLRGMTTAVDFLREISLTGKSTLIGENVVVVGGGDVAMDCARSALRAGAKSARVVCLEQECELPASKHEQTAAEEEGVKFDYGWCVEEVITGLSRVASLRLKNCLALTDAAGKFNPLLGQEAREIPCDTIIYAIGQRVEDIAEGKLRQFNSGRYIVDPETLATDMPGVFVAGDAAGSTIVIEAMALGRKAALSADRYLRGQQLDYQRNYKLEASYKTEFEVPIPPETQNTPRSHTRLVAAEIRKSEFAECDLGFDDDTAKVESERCLECECKDCMKECLMLNEFTQCPGELFGVFLANGQVEPIVPYSCNMCNQCTLVCPEEFKLADAFMAMRKDFVVANQGKSPIKGHGAIDIHQKLSFSGVFTIKRKGRK